MKRPADVPAVMRQLADLALNSGGRRGEDEDDNEPAIALYESALQASEAINELIAAATDLNTVLPLSCRSVEARKKYARFCAAIAAVQS